ncbi:hypothetical protein H0H93_005949, partial [Arthromyces matolae]
LPVNLHTLELGLTCSPEGYINTSGLLSMIMPDLRVLLLDWVRVVDPSKTKEFWKKHPRLERLELGWGVSGEWFNGFETGMLPNLTILKSDFISAKILLPHISESLISLYLWGTYNAQAPYLLRTVPKRGILPALRSLGIQQQECIISSMVHDEGHHWREDENGTVTGAPLRKEARKFDGNYIMSIATAAPNLEELELMAVHVHWAIGLHHICALPSSQTQSSHLIGSHKSAQHAFLRIMQGLDGIRQDFLPNF